MLIRAATLADVPAVVGIHVESWDAAKEGLALPTRRSRKERTEQWQRYLGEARGTLLVACDPEPVGFIAYGPSRDQDRARETEIHMLYVAPAQWGMGIGSALVSEVPSDLPVSLWVAERNERARALYARLGFEPDGAIEAGHHVPQMRLARPGCR